VRESRTPGSARGGRGNPVPYRYRINLSQGAECCPTSSPTGVGPMMNGSFNRSFFCGQIVSGRDQPRSTIR